MKILLTNDDGIDAPGLQALWHSIDLALDHLTTEIIVVAPDRGRSECGHSVTSGRPLHITELRPGWFSIDGTPVDCVRAGLSILMPDATAVISGVNAGANLGVDLLHSGTFAAAREAALQNVPGMAVSHYRRPEIPRTWDHVPNWLSTTLVEFADRACQFDRRAGRREIGEIVLWNVNLPAIDPAADAPKRVRCEIDPCPIGQVGLRDESKITFQANFHDRPRNAGTDVDRCFAGSLTISEIAQLI